MNRRDFFKKIAGVASAALVGGVASKAAVPSLADGGLTVEISNSLPPSLDLYDLGVSSMTVEWAGTPLRKMVTVEQLVDQSTLAAYSYAAIGEDEVTFFDGDTEEWTNRWI